MQNHVVTTVTMICLCILLTTTCLHGDTTATTGDSMTTVTGIDNIGALTSEQQQTCIAQSRENYYALEKRLVRQLTPEVSDEVKSTIITIMGDYHMEKTIGIISKYITLSDLTPKSFQRGRQTTHYPAVSALIKIGTRATPTMLKLIKESDDKAVRSCSTFVIQGIYGPKIGKYILAEKLESTNDETTRNRFEEAIARLDESLERMKSQEHMLQ